MVGNRSLRSASAMILSSRSSVAGWRIPSKQTGKTGVEVGFRGSQQLSCADDSCPELCCGQGAFPSGVRVDHDQGCDQVRVAPIEFQDHRAAPRAARDVGGSKIHCLDQCREVVGEISQREFVRQVAGFTGSGFIPGYDGELVS